MAGEYAVASEVCRRNFYAQITLGHLKRTDILVYNPERDETVFLEVKAKQGREWPGIKGVVGDKRLIVLVDFQNKKRSERPDFYILDAKDWQDFLKTNVMNRPQFARLEDDYIPIWKDEYRGTGIQSIHISQHLEKWEKLTSMLIQ